MIQIYFDQIKTLVDTYSTTSFVLQNRLDFEVRPGGQGYLSGSITFQDSSVLHFREYLDEVGETLHKEMYTYHYQDTDATLIFRYDNARHRPPLATREHKHTPDTIVETAAPTLEDVLAEIAASSGWVP